uniref:Retrovirus-related Pol polyprotein from transposon TNT 1-94 n=1 Tax=Cajanus cajan TaxID=3821 RepID=A0A151RTV1_CAJCA|nr:hypothetical protein KK1_032473 [Cajanus cajan]
MNAKARQLCTELRNTNLENQTISNYVLWIQTLVDALTAIGDFLSVKEHLDILLEGLLEEYESTVSLISSCFDLLSIEEVETLLLGHESRLEKFKKKVAASLNVTTPSFEPNPPIPHPQANLTHQDLRPQFAHRRGGRTNCWGGCFPNRGGRGHGRYAGFQCQVCNRYGNVASSCYYRFDETYVLSSLLEALQFITANFGPWYNTQSAPAHYISQSSQSSHSSPHLSGILGPRPQPPSQIHFTSTLV